MTSLFVPLRLVKRISVLVFFFSMIFSTCFCQTKVFEHQTGWNGGKHRVSLHSFLSQTIYTVIAIESDDSLKAVMLNANMKAIHEFTVALEPHEAYAGGFVKNGMIAVLLKSPGKMHTWKYDAKTKEVSDESVSFDISGEKLVTEISVPGRFLYVTALKKEPVLNVYNFNLDGKYEHSRYDLSEDSMSTGYSRKDLWQALTKQKNLTREMDLVNVANEVECDVDVANSPNKIYVKSDSLYLLMDKEWGITRIFSVDLVSKILKYRCIRRELGSYDEKNKGNSFLCGNSLYYVAASHDSLWVMANNFNDGSLIMNYNCDRNGEISFKNTPIMQEGIMNLNAPTSIKEIDKTSEFLKKMMTGGALITATINPSNECEIMVGAYKEIKETMMPPMNFSEPYRGLIYGTYMKQWQRTIRFKLLVDPFTMKRIDKGIGMSIIEKADHYKNGIKVPTDGDTFLNINNRFYYSYYDSGERSMCIIKF